MLDQFYWAERMFWLGVAAEPLKREHLVPDTDDDFYVTEAAKMLAKAINHSLSPEVKTRALQIATALSTEVNLSRKSLLWFLVMSGWYKQLNFHPHILSFLTGWSIRSSAELEGRA